MKVSQQQITLLHPSNFVRVSYVLMRRYYTRLNLSLVVTLWIHSKVFVFRHVWFEIGSPKVVKTLPL